MKKSISFVIAGLLAAASFQARAIIVIAPQTVSFVGNSDGVIHPNNCLYIAPGYADFTANDDDMAWTSPALLPAPVPVPEPATFALLVASSAFAFCLLKDRLNAR
jgi:hypothetical protein